MGKFKEGGIVWHKSTGHKCVIIRINDDNTIKVRTEKDEEKDYYSQELKTDEEVEMETRNTYSGGGDINDDPYY
jgi:hypothetical protein